jgi:hypothetical protein
MTTPLSDTQLEAALRSAALRESSWNVDAVDLEQQQHSVDRLTAYAASVATDRQPTGLVQRLLRLLRRWLPFVVVLAVGGGVATAAVINRWRVGGVEVSREPNTTFTDETPTFSIPQSVPSSKEPVTQLGPGWLGSPISMADAVSMLGEPVRLPASLGSPNELLVRHLGGSPGVSLITAVWAMTPQLPAGTDPDIGLLLSQFVGTADADPILMKKGIGMGVVIDSVETGDSVGLWISGSPHEIRMSTGDGQFTEVPLLAQQTLLWTNGRITYRLEGALSKDDAIRIAQSMR